MYLVSKGFSEMMFSINGGKKIFDKWFLQNCHWFWSNEHCSSAKPVIFANFGYCKVSISTNSPNSKAKTLFKLYLCFSFVRNTIIFYTKNGIKKYSQAWSNERLTLLQSVITLTGIHGQYECLPQYILLGISTIILAIAKKRVVQKCRSMYHQSVQLLLRINCIEKFQLYLMFFKIISSAPNFTRVKARPPFLIITVIVEFSF